MWSRNEVLENKVENLCLKSYIKISLNKKFQKKKCNLAAITI